MGYVRALRVESVVGVRGVVDDLQLAVAVEEAVAAAHLAVLVALLVPELAVVPWSEIQSNIACRHIQMRDIKGSNEPPFRSNVLNN